MKKLFQSILDFVKNLFSKANPIIRKAVETGIKIVEAIKSFDDKNAYVADILTSLIPGDTDDKIKAKVREELPKIMIELKLVDATWDAKDPNDIMNQALKVLNLMDSDYQSAFLHSIAVLIAKVAADGELSWSDSVYLAEYIYNKEYKNA